MGHGGTLPRHRRAEIERPYLRMWKHVDRRLVKSVARLDCAAEGVLVFSLRCDGGGHEHHGERGRGGQLHGAGLPARGRGGCAEGAGASERCQGGRPELPLPPAARGGLQVRRGTPGRESNEKVTNCSVTWRV